MNNISIRKCEIKDESAFIKLNLSFMQEVLSVNPYWTTLKIPNEEEMKGTFRGALSMPEHILIFVVEIDGKVIGYANTLTVYSIWSRGKALTIDDLYIEESFRRNGIGERVMEYIFQFAEQNGYNRVQLHAELDNEKAHNLYKKLGFTQEEIMFFMKKI